MMPATGSPGQAVGNGNDYVATSSGAVVGSSVGSFTTTGLTNEVGGTGPAFPGSVCLSGNGVPNCFSLQVNSQFFTTSSPFFTGTTTGWEQFVFSNDCTSTSATGCLYMQYWLIGYIAGAITSCPATVPPGGTGWFKSGNSCFANSPAVSTGPKILATSLGKLSLTGCANCAHTGLDMITLSVSGGTPPSFAVTENDTVVNLYQHWMDSEFNVVGDCCGSQAVFNDGTSIKVSTTLVNVDGGPIASTCTNTGYTGETNNLYLQPCSGGSSGISFVECLGTNPNAPSTCASTSGVPEFPSGAGQLMIVAIGMILALVVRRRRAPRTDPSLQIIA